MLFLMTVFAVFYFLWLGSYPIFTPDEGRYSEVAREMLAYGNFITPKVNGVPFLDKPVLYYWLQAAAMHLFGVHEWSVRFFPAVYGIHGCLAVYLATRRLFTRRAGLVSAIILAATPLYFGGAHYANLDLEVAVLVSTCLLAFIVAAQSDGKTRTALFLLAYVFAALAFLTKGLIAIAFPAIIGGLWILILSRWSLLLRMQLGIGIILFAAITLPWFFLVQSENPEFLHFFFITQQVTRFLSTADFNNKTPGWFYVPILLAGFIPWTAFFFQGAIKQLRDCWASRKQHAVELFLLLWVAVVLIFFSIPRSKTITYILPIFPPMAMITGKFIAEAWDKSARQTNILIGVICVIIFNVVIAGILLTLPNHHRLNLPPTIAPFLFVAAGELLVSALLLIFLRTRLHMSLIFTICTITSAAMLLTFTLSAKHINVNTAKPLITKLQTILKPSDTIVNYFKFYQDVPLYLDRRIILVADWKSPDIESRDNWVRELWYSMPYHDTDEFLYDEPTFWKLWNSTKRVYVFVNNNYLAQFQASTNKLFFIGQYNNIILLSNQLAPAGH